MIQRERYTYYFFIYPAPQCQDYLQHTADTAPTKDAAGVHVETKVAVESIWQPVNLRWCSKKNSEQRRHHPYDLHVPCSCFEGVAGDLGSSISVEQREGKLIMVATTQMCESSMLYAASLKRATP